MTQLGRRREVGRGERVLPGVFRLRLPLPWPGVPHGNAWAIAAGDGVVLVDTGIHEPGSLGHLERALDQVGLRLEHVRLLVCTHAHADHYGQAKAVTDRSGCELWMHPRFEHARRFAADPDAVIAARLEVARQSGLPTAALEQYGAQRQGTPSGIEAIVEPARELVAGVVVETDLGDWSVHETPGHAPSHVCLFQRERRLLISGDHLLGRVSLYFDASDSPDPAGEFLRSLDVVDGLDARLCLAGHGRTFTDVRAHVVANRALVGERLARTLAAISGDEPVTAFAVVPHVHDEPLTPLNTTWWLSETVVYLTHLEATGRAERVAGEPERWRKLG